MGVTNTNAYDGPFYPNGVTSSFPFTFRTMSTNEVQIFAPDSTLITGFSFSIVPAANADGGTIIFDTPPSAAQLPAFFVASSPNFGVGIDLGSVTAFNPRTLNPSFERLAVQNIFLRDRISRTPELPIGQDLAGYFASVGADNQWTFSEGTGNQSNAVTVAFVAVAGQTQFLFPFALLIAPRVVRNGVKLPRGGYNWVGNIVTLGSGVDEGDTIEISVGEPVAEQIYDIRGPFVLRDLSPGYTPVPTGIYFGQGGNSLSFETLISSPSGAADSDNQRASLLLVAVTSDGGNSEEQTLCLLTKIRTGYCAEWAQSTAYTVGTEVRNSTTNNVYRCTTAGTSAGSGPGPTGKTAGITDGTCVWLWINDAAINSKASFYNETVVEAGGGDSWAQANNIHVQAGNVSRNIFNTELDLTNDSGIDSEIGGLNKYGLALYVGGANRSTAGIQVSQNGIVGVGGKALLWGMNFNGPNLASRSVIAIDASSAVGIGFGNGSGAGGVAAVEFTTATIVDSSTAPTGAIFGGAYSSAGINVTGPTPASYVSTGTKTLSGFFENSVAPRGMIFTGTYSKSPIKFATLPPNHADDAAAASGGLEVGDLYRTGSILKVRAA